MTEVVRRGSKSLVRDINNSRVLHAIQVRSPISRAEIAKLAELPPPTVTSIINEFLRAGLVRETDIVRPVSDGLASLGRRPILLTLNHDAAFTVGIKLRQGSFTLTVANLGGESIQHVHEFLDDNSPQATMLRITDTVNDAVAGAKLDPAQVLGLAIGVPGVIDHVSGVCRYSPLLRWTDVNVKSELERRLDLPVYVDNDVNMVTAAEIAYGAGRAANDFLTVTVGQGIGLGIVIRGEIYRGACGGAGELGHTKVGHSLICPCGERGCLEAIASEPAICAQVVAALNLTSVSIEDVMAQALNAEPVVLSVLHEAGTALGTSLGNLINLFNPERVIVTGEGTRLGPSYFRPMHDAARDVAFNRLRDDTQIVVQEWGDEAWAQGAASMVVHELLKPPIYESALGGSLNRLLRRRRQAVAGR